MRDKLRQIFRPVLKIFESGEGDFEYRESYRTILLAVGGLFSMLGLGSFYLSIVAATYSGLVPGVIFLTLGVVCLIVALLGNDRAVAKIWRNR